MSIRIQISALTDVAKERIDSELRVPIDDSQKNKFVKSMSARYVYPYRIDGLDVTLPFAFAHEELKLPRATRSPSSAMSVEFSGNLRPEQAQAQSDVIRILNRTGSVLLCLPCGGGKTVTTIATCCMVKLKVLVVVNKLVLLKQWEDSIRAFVPTARVAILRPPSKTKKNQDVVVDADFYLINAINIPKLGASTFRDIRCLVLDEVHLLMAERLSELTHYIHPRYLIGLSATPYRLDGLNKLLDLLFGSDRVVRVQKREHIVCKVDTGFKPAMELTRANKINWSSVLESQASDPGRNELIVQLVKKNHDRCILILVKRIAQGEHLAARLVEEGESVASLLGASQTFDKSARVLIGTTQKVGVGFDHPKLDSLILACDLKDYFVQYLFRVFRRPDVKPVIFDLVDDNHLLKQHYRSREKVYIENGGVIKRKL